MTQTVRTPWIAILMAVSMLAGAGSAAADERKRLSVIGKTSLRSLMDSFVPRSTARPSPRRRPPKCITAAPRCRRADACCNASARFLKEYGFWSTCAPRCCLT